MRVTATRPLLAQRPTWVVPRGRLQLHAGCTPASARTPRATITDQRGCHASRVARRLTMMACPSRKPSRGKSSTSLARSAWPTYRRSGGGGFWPKLQRLRSARGRGLCQHWCRRLGTRSRVAFERPGLRIPTAGGIRSIFRVQRHAARMRRSCAPSSPTEPLADLFAAPAAVTRPSSRSAPSEDAWSPPRSSLSSA